MAPPPGEVHVVAVGAGAEQLRAALRELALELREGGDLRRAHEGEVLGPEEDHLPAAREAVVAEGLEGGLGIRRDDPGELIGGKSLSDGEHGVLLARRQKPGAFVRRIGPVGRLVQVIFSIRPISRIDRDQSVGGATRPLAIPRSIERSSAFARALMAVRRLSSPPCSTIASSCSARISSARVRASRPAWVSFSTTPRRSVRRAVRSSSPCRSSEVTRPESVGRLTRAWVASSVTRTGSLETSSSTRYLARLMLLLGQAASNDLVSQASRRTALTRSESDWQAMRPDGRSALLIPSAPGPRRLRTSTVPVRRLYDTTAAG